MWTEWMVVVVVVVLVANTVAVANQYMTENLWIILVLTSWTEGPHIQYYLYRMHAV